MPGSTFLNLAPEKQEKLLSAAVREFTERPYNEASINRIIRAAHIPRGSFYMYFRDKEDLFQYLTRESVDELLMVLRELLLSCGGDVFTALPALYDYLSAHQTESGDLGGFGLLPLIVNRNCGMQKSGLLEFLDPETVLDQLSESVNPDLLDLRSDEDLDHILRMVLAMSLPIMYNSLRPGGDPEGRETLVNVLEILRRGVGAKASPPAEHA